MHKLSFSAVQVIVKCTLKYALYDIMGLPKNRNPRNARNARNPQNVRNPLPKNRNPRNPLKCDL